MTFAAVAEIPEGVPRFFGRGSTGAAVIFIADSLFSDQNLSPLARRKYKVVHLGVPGAAVYAGRVDVARCGLGRAKRGIRRERGTTIRSVVSQLERGLKSCARDHQTRDYVVVLFGAVSPRGTSYIYQFESPQFRPRRRHVLATVGDLATDEDFRDTLDKQGWPPTLGDGPAADGRFSVAFTGAVERRHQTVEPPVQGYVVHSQGVDTIGLSHYHDRDDVWTKESEPPHSLL